MKIVINGCYGLFDFSKKGIELLKQYGYDWPFYAFRMKAFETEQLEIRTLPALIEAIENGQSAELGSEWAKLRIIEIPDCATDWKVISDDGFETVAFVKDGKIYFAG